MRRIAGKLLPGMGYLTRGRAGGAWKQGLARAN